MPLVTFWRTFHHDGKIIPAWWRWGGARLLPFTLSTITSQVVVYAPGERADTVHSSYSISPLPLHVVCAPNPPASISKHTTWAACWWFGSMNEIPRKKITITSSLNEISTDKLGNKGLYEREALLRQPPPLYTTGFWTDIQRRRERFSLPYLLYFPESFQDVLQLCEGGCPFNFEML